MLLFDGIGKRCSSAFTCCDQFCDMWKNMEARRSNSQYWCWGQSKKKWSNLLAMLSAHRQSRRSLYGTRFRSEISCEMDQPFRWTDLWVRSQSLNLSVSVQRTASDSIKFSWSPTFISGPCTIQPSRVYHDRCNRTSSIFWWRFRGRSCRSANSGNFSFRNRILWFEDGPKLQLSGPARSRFDFFAYCLYSICWI